MLHVSRIDYAPVDTPVGEQIAQLRHLLSLVEEIAGQPASSTDAFEEMARISGAYAAAPEAVQRRFDALAAETADWAAVGVWTLIAARASSHRPTGAARQLANELTRTLCKLDRLVL
jgi:hypothetical protein